MQRDNSLLKDWRLFVIIGIGLVLRLYRIGVQSLWFDEAYSVYMAKGLSPLWFDQIRDSSPPLYYTILHFWMGWFGKDEISLRLLSAFFGILLIPSIYAAGTLLFDKRAGLFAALMLAISPIQIYYSQEVKMYTLLPLLSLISFFSLYMCLKENKRRYWAIYGVTTILILYTHNYAVFLLMAELCFFVFSSHKPKGAFLRFALTQGLVILLFLPRAEVILQQASLDMNSWIQAPALFDLNSTFMHFSLLSWRVAFTKVLSKTVNLSLPFFILVFLSGIYGRQKNRLFLLSYLVIPLGLAFLLSYKMPVYVSGRYDMIVFPAFCLIMAAGISRFKIRLLRWFVAGLIILSTTIALHHYYFVYIKSNDRRVAQYLQERLDKDDVLVITELSSTPFEYYWKYAWRPKLFRFPEGPRAALTRKAFLSDPAYAESEIQRVTDKIYPLLNENNELLVVYQPIELSDRLLVKLNRDLKCQDFVEFLPGDNLNQVRRVYIFKRAVANKSG